MSARSHKQKDIQIVTSPLAVNRYRREPVVANEVSFSSAVWDVLARALVYVYLGKAEVDHIYQLLVRWQTNHAVAQLYVAVQYSSVVHGLQPPDLQRT